MPNYDLQCTDCGKIEERYAAYEQRCHQRCKCGKPMDIIWTQKAQIAGNPFKPFTDWITGGDNPDGSEQVIQSRDEWKRKLKAENAEECDKGKGWIPDMKNLPSRTRELIDGA